MNLTPKQYHKAIINCLSSRDIEVLSLLYYSPNSSATAKELTKEISPTSEEHIIANRFIGKIGKSIAEYYQLKLDTYKDRDIKRQSYFSIIGPYTSENGWEMHNSLKVALQTLEKTGELDNLINQLSTEVNPKGEDFFEGAVEKVYVNKFERNRIARLKCIEHYGDKCIICDFDFGKVYGSVAKGVIHVHHKTPLSKARRNKKIDPVNDLIPVCPNCHSVIHLQKECFTEKEMKLMIKKANKIKR